MFSPLDGLKVNSPLLFLFFVGEACFTDGRLGYQRSDKGLMQLCPCPLLSLAVPSSTVKEPNPKQFICKKVSAGSRHTLYLMIDCSKNLYKEVEKVRNEDEKNDDDYYEQDTKEKKKPPKRKRKILISGLNHD
jgi:hypothetical protein